MLSTILLIVLISLLPNAIPTWPYSQNRESARSGLLNHSARHRFNIDIAWKNVI